MGFLSSLTGSNTGKATVAAANQNKGLIDTFRTNAHQMTDLAAQNSRLELEKGIENFQPWVNNGQAASTMYANATGLNGADGNAAATNAFQAGPGYQYAVDQSLKAALRGASAGGMLASGNTLAALQDRGNSLADQEFGSWLDRLNGQSQTGLAAAGQQQQGYNATANLYQGVNDTRLGIDSSALGGRIDSNNQVAAGKEAKVAAQGSFLGNLLGGIGSIATKKVATGGLF